MMLLSVAIHTLAPAWYALICALAAAVLTWLLYRRQQGFPGVFKWILPALRFTGLFFLLILLLSPFIRITSNREEKPLLQVYFDHSASIDTAAFSGTYRQGMQLLTGLNDLFDIRFYRFAADVVVANDSLKNRSVTDLGAVAAHVNEAGSGKTTGAVVVFSDGIVNRGLNPSLVRLSKNPALFAVGMGDTVQYPDLKISGLQLNESVFLGSEFSVEASLTARNIQALSWKADLREDGRVVASRTGSFGSGNGFARLSFSVVPKTPGIHRYEIAVTPAVGEKNLANNTGFAVTEVVDTRKKVALVAHSPHPDMGAISRVLEDNARYTLLSSTPGMLPDPASADVFVVHGMPANEAENAWLGRVAAAGKPVFAMASLQTRNQGFAGLFSVTMPAAGRAEDVQPVLNPDFTEFSSDFQDAGRVIGSWPPLKAAWGRYGSDASLKVMLRQKIGQVATDYPLFAFRENGRSRQAILLGEGIWKWRLKEYAATKESRVFDDLISKTIQYIASSGRRERFNTRSTRPVYDPDEPVVLLAQHYDAAMNPVNDQPCSVTIKGPQGFVRTLDMGRNGKSYRLETGVLPPGDYTYTAMLKGKESHQASSAFQVSSVGAEAADKVANHGLLRLWAGSNGGRFVKAAAAEMLPDLIRKYGRSQAVIYTENSVTDLIRAKWLFVLIVALFSAEWLLRKYLGGY